MRTPEARRAGRFAWVLATLLVAGCFFDWDAYQAPGNGGEPGGGGGTTSGGGGTTSGEGGTAQGGSTVSCKSCAAWALECTGSLTCPPDTPACAGPANDAATLLIACICAVCSVPCTLTCTGQGSENASCANCMLGAVGMGGAGGGLSCGPQFDECMQN